MSNRMMYGEARGRMARSLLRHGHQFGSEDWGAVWVMDGKVYLVDTSSVQMLGDYFEFCEAIRLGLRPGFVRHTENG